MKLLELLLRLVVAVRFECSYQIMYRPHSTGWKHVLYIMTLFSTTIASPETQKLSTITPKWRVPNNTKSMVLVIELLMLNCLMLTICLAYDTQATTIVFLIIFP